MTRDLDVLHCPPVVVALHLVVEHLALFGGGVGDELRLNNLQDVVADVRQFRLDLRLVVPNEGKLVTLHHSDKCEGHRRLVTEAVA